MEIVCILKNEKMVATVFLTFYC